MKVRQLATGILSYVPGMNHFMLRRTGGTESARYCYAVWLRHLVMAYQNGLTTFPTIVAELGPGDSLGMGLAALLSGAELYYAFDVVRYANSSKNMKIFNQLLQLYSQRADLPDRSEFPMLSPDIKGRRFPFHILGTDQLTQALSTRRVRRIRESLLNVNSDFSQIKYTVPWQKTKLSEKGSIDFFVSHAVFEHVEDVQSTYKAIYDYLKPGGMMSHQIDFKSHNTHQKWNGHWTYSPRRWALIRGKKPFLINREPHSTHVRLIKQSGFEILYDRQVKKSSNITRKDLAPQFQYLTQDDIITSGAFIQARKPVSIQSETAQVKRGAGMESMVNKITTA